MSSPVQSPKARARDRRRNRSLHGLVGLVSVGLSLSGCELDWEKPDISVPPPPKFNQAKAVSSPVIAGGADFAQKFRSKELHGLVTKALADNLDLAAAAARITQADAQARVASAALWPSISTIGAARGTQTPGTALEASSGGLFQGANAATRRYGFFQLGLSASYEIDFWGKNEDASSAARLLANASRFNRDTVEIGIVAAVMNAYFQLLTAQDRVTIAKNNMAIAQTIFDAMKARMEVGTASLLDVAQQQSVLAQTKAAIPPLEQAVLQTRNILAVLVGEAPERLQPQGGSLTSLTFPKVTPGLPSEVLLRRPDVAEAEARLASAEFSVLQARAAFFPSVTLTGQYGVASAFLQNLLRPEAIAWTVASQLAQPLFDGFNLQGQYDLQKGRFAELAALYHKQILNALTDTENALIAVNETGKQLEAQSEAVAAAKVAYEAADARMRQGTTDIITLSTTELTYFHAQDALAVVRLTHFQAATSLYQALGGGWSPTTRNLELMQAAAAYESDKGLFP